MPRSPLFSLSLRYWNYNLRQILGGIIIRSNYDVREIALSFGVAFHAIILFSSIITSSVYLHSLRFAGRFSRRLCLGCHFLPLLSERLDLRCSTDIGRIIIRSNYDVRQILVLWFGVSPPRDNTVLFYYNILRLSSLFTLRRSILTAVMLGLPLFIFLLFFHFFYHFSFLTYLL